METENISLSFTALDIARISPEQMQAIADGLTPYVVPAPLVILKTPPFYTRCLIRCFARGIYAQPRLATWARKLTIVMRLPLGELKDRFLARVITLTAKPVWRLGGVRGIILIARRLEHISESSRCHFIQSVVNALLIPCYQLSNLLCELSCFLMIRHGLICQRRISRLKHRD